MALVDLTAFITTAVFATSPVARDWLKLIRYLGAFSERQPRPAKPGQTARLHDLRIATQHIHDVAQILQDWPHGLWSLLDRARWAGPSSDRLAQAFGPIYSVLYRHLAAPCFQFLRDAFEAYLHGHWWGLLCRRNRSLKSTTIDAHPRLSIRQAAQQARTTSVMAEQYIQQSKLDLHEPRAGNWRRRRTVHASFVLTLSAATAKFVTLGTAAHRLALPAKRVRQLLAHDMVPFASPQQSKSHQAGTRWRIDASALAAMNQVDGSPRVSEITNAVALKKFAREWRLSEQEFCALVHAVRTRAVETSGLSYDRPLGDKLVDKQVVRKFTANLRRSPESWFSVDQAAQALKMKQQVAYQLVRAGLLASTLDDTRGRKVRRDAVDEFRRDYVALAEIAKLCNESPKVCLARIQVKPVCGPGIDGIRQYFYRRADAPHLLEAARVNFVASLFQVENATARVR